MTDYRSFQSAAARRAFANNLNPNSPQIAGMDRIVNTFNTSRSAPNSALGLADPNNSYNKHRTAYEQTYGGALVKRSLWSIYRERIMDAFSNRKIFTVYGNHPIIRQALLSRGWLERLTHGRFPKIQHLEDEILVRHVRHGNDYEAVALSRLLNSFPSFFIWQDRGQPDLCADVRPYRNIIRRGRNLDFVTKVGLIGCSEQEQWINAESKCHMNYPRFYRLGGQSDDQDAFIKDYKLTQCLSLFRFTRDRIRESQRLYDFDKGTVPTAILAFALNHLKRCMRDLDHSIVDVNQANEPPEENASEWKTFLQQSHEVLHYGAKFRGGFKELLQFVRVAQTYLTKFQEKYPSMKWDGHRNLWILKPGYQCRGNGIVVRFLLDDILQFTGSNANRRYIAQKYIERPLLIYKTKFDIRLYMLVTIGDTMIKIWLYKDCYIKLCSHELNLDDLSEKIHLTNNTVQRKYKNESNRHPNLPSSNMWSLQRFKEFLRDDCNAGHVWDTKIFNGIKENLNAVVLSSLEETELVPNAFELYGCDFMVDEHFTPILIEINATPDMTASTEVTQRLCPNVLKDVVRVVVDVPNKPFASTGGFELIMEENYRQHKNFNPDTSLNISGRAMKLRPFRAYHAIKKIQPYKPTFIAPIPKVPSANINTNGKGVILSFEKPLMRKTITSPPVGGRIQPNGLKTKKVEIKRKMAA